MADLATLVYPYKNSWKWIVYNRYRHLEAIVHTQHDLLDGRMGRTVKHRLRALQTGLKVRAGIILLLSMGLIAALVGYIVDAVAVVDAEAAAAAEDVDSLAGSIARIATSLSGALTILYLAANRFLGQVEIDILGILATNPGMMYEDSQ